MTDNGVELPSLVDLLAPRDSTTQPPLDLGSASAQSYVKRLASLSLYDLKQEPATIRNERGAVENELVNLCYREYPTFTSVHRCSSAVGAAFDDFESSLGDLIDSIPALEQECRQFAKGNSDMQATRRRAVLLLDHEDKLLDVLEIPQLMDTCVRNGYYQEALDLASHVASLKSKMHLGIMDDVALEVEGILQLMTAQLLSVLRTPVKLPNLLKAVNFLRRLQQLDEVDLALVFLSSRLHNYRARLVEIEGMRAEPIRYLRRYIDLFREHVFDIISQYTTIFQNSVDDQLPTFACLCVEDLVDLVRRYIPRIASDSAAMSSVMVQLGYCSLSFSRVGLDFSALLLEPFAMSISLSYEQAVATAASLFSETLSVGARDSASPSSLLISTPHLQQVLADPDSPPAFVDQDDTHTPHSTLAHYPPLAHFVNAHLTSLNALRLLAPYHLLASLVTAQSRSICQASEALLDYIEQAVAIETATTRSTSGSRHVRTNSSPRASLIRRNTETQLSYESLQARRREAKRVCVAFAAAWLHTVAFLVRGLAHVMEEGLPSTPDLDVVSARVRSWISDNAEVPTVVQEADMVHGTVTTEEPADVKHAEDVLSVASLQYDRSKTSVPPDPSTPPAVGEPSHQVETFEHGQGEPSAAATETQPIVEPNAALNVILPAPAPSPSPPDADPEFSPEANVTDAGSHTTPDGHDEDAAPSRDAPLSSAVASPSPEAVGSGTRLAPATLAAPMTAQTDDVGEEVLVQTSVDQQAQLHQSGTEAAAVQGVDASLREAAAPRMLSESPPEPPTQPSEVEDAGARAEGSDSQLHRPVVSAVAELLPTGAGDEQTPATTIMPTANGTMDDTENAEVHEEAADVDEGPADPPTPAESNASNTEAAAVAKSAPKKKKKKKGKK